MTLVIDESCLLSPEGGGGALSHKLPERNHLPFSGRNISGFSDVTERNLTDTEALGL